MFRLIDWIMKNIPWLKRIFENRNTFVMSMVVGYVEREKYPQALELCMNSLRKESGNVGAAEITWYWLQLKYAVLCAKKLNRTDLREELVGFAENAPPLAHKYREASNIFIELSRWSFEEKNTDKMMSLAKRALATDDTWAYPWFLLGWYGLFIDGIDSLQYLSKAIELDSSFLEKIHADDLCLKNKAILAVLFE